MIIHGSVVHCFYNLEGTLVVTFDVFLFHAGQLGHLQIKDCHSVVNSVVVSGSLV